MPNRLIQENSPYLLQHAHNPVNWYPWSAEALTIARLEDKPIFLSIGYAACHWCHVMEHESFEDTQTAVLMNDNFINIKVDREERPDLDSIYMNAVVAMTGQGGWPLSVFLTPDLNPYYGGTYFPPARRHNMPAFSEVLLAVSNLWRADRGRVLVSSHKITEYLQKSQAIDQPALSLSIKNLDQAVASLAQGYDWKNGGWGKAPKFPQPMAIEFLLRKATRGDKFAHDIAEHALIAMARGGMYDVVGGGFARYSTDDFWCIPHFEKMLSDNAQLSLVYLHGWLVTGIARFRQVCEEILDFVLRELTHPLGGFFSSLDADSEGEEGKYYAWSLNEIITSLAAQDADFAIAAYNLTQDGNFEGMNVLQLALTGEQLASHFQLPLSEITGRFHALHQKLLSIRSQRTHPGTDDKILTSWNALMLAAFAEAGHYLKKPDYLHAARRNARFLLENLFIKGRLMRSWRNGQARHNAYLEDHAALVLGLLALYQSDSNPTWFKAARELIKEILAHFPDPAGGFYDTRDDHETLLVRPKDIQDNATPSGNALAVNALLQLAAFEGRSDWRLLAEEMLARMIGVMLRYSASFAQWLQAADFMVGPSFEVAILGDQANSRTQALASVLSQKYRPRQVAARSEFPPCPGSPALLDGRILLNNLPTAFVCQGFTCLLPTTSPETFAAQLEVGSPED
jgi:uncharacterized protein